MLMLILRTKIYPLPLSRLQSGSNKSTQMTMMIFITTNAMKVNQIIITLKGLVSLNCHQNGLRYYSHKTYQKRKWI